jgi:predicted DNA binding protein
MSIVVVDMKIPCDHIDLGRVLCGETDARITVTQFIPIGESVVPYLWAETAEPDTFEEQVRADEHVASLERLAGAEERYLYRIEWAQELDGLLTSFREHDLVVEQAVGTQDEWRFTFRGPNHENISSFANALEGHGITPTIESLRNIDSPDPDLLSMTDKQREAVELAFQQGYFSVPRETKLSELADQCNISRQSFSRRLTRGLGNLLEETAIPEQPNT